MKNTGRFILCLLVVWVALSSLYKYAWLGLANGLPPPFRDYAPALYIHLFAAVTALLLGPLQFWTRLRQQRRQLHRLLGRIYLGVGILLGGLSGLYLSMFAQGGMVGRLGFAGLALAWLYTGFKAYKAIRAGQVEQHRAWMVRNFALTLAAVTFRIYLPLGMMAGIDFLIVYPADAWLCWVPNLLLAELFVNRRRAVGLGAPLRAPSA